MKRKYNIFQIDAFTEEPFKGNPAGVTFAPDLTDEEMQTIAAEMNLSETAFISASDKGDYRLRWFTPKVEVDLCGHATIASLHYLNELGKIKDRSKIIFDTRSGILNCPVENNLYSMEIPIPQLEEFDYNEDILDALGIEKNAITENYPFIQLNTGYLYIYSKSLKAIKEMNPDFNQLGTLCSKYSFDAVTIFTRETYDENSFAHSRFFAPQYGIPEDPVTGSANGPLMLVLKKLNLLEENGNITTKIFEQGDVIGRKGRVKVTHNSATNELYIAGNAVTVIRGELTI